MRLVEPAPVRRHDLLQTRRADRRRHDRRSHARGTTGRLISAATLVGVNFLVGLATYKSKKLEAIIEGRPQVLIHNGKLYEEVMASAHLTHHELHAALRQAGCGSIEDVRSAVLENSGSIS